MKCLTPGYLLSAQWLDLLGVRGDRLVFSRPSSCHLCKSGHYAGYPHMGCNAREVQCPVRLPSRVRDLGETVGLPQLGIE